MTAPEDFYTDAQRKLQSENGNDNLAVAVAHAIVRDELEDIHIDYIESRDYFFPFDGRCRWRTDRVL